MVDTWKNKNVMKKVEGAVEFSYKAAMKTFIEKYNSLYGLGDLTKILFANKGTELYKMKAATWKTFLICFNPTGQHLTDRMQSSWVKTPTGHFSHTKKGIDG